MHRACLQPVPCYAGTHSGLAGTAQSGQPRLITARPGRRGVSKGNCSLYRKLMSGAAGVALMLGAAGCDGLGRAKVDAIQNEPPVRSASLVEATRPERRDISAYLEETGHITAENQVEVLAKGTGHCLAVHVEEGDRVEQGAVLAELDKAEMEAQVRQSEANLSHQKMTLDRAEELFRSGLGSEADRDNSRSSYEQARATLEMQRVQLSFLTIRAPISGIVTKRQIQQGILVSSGMPAFNIVDPTSYILPIQVTERSLPRLRVGQEARVTIDSSGARAFRAQVRRINPGIDPQTGTVKVILDFDPSDYDYLRESAFARYQLVMETHENALAVPKDAVIEENARRFVMVVVEATDAVPAPEVEAETASRRVAQTGWVAARREVDTGLEDSAYTEILSGIDDDSLVITLGQQTVSEGDPVKVGNLEETLQSLDSLGADELLEKAREERKRQDGAAAAPDSPTGS